MLTVPTGHESRVSLIDGAVATRAFDKPLRFRLLDCLDSHLHPGAPGLIRVMKSAPPRGSGWVMLSLREVYRTGYYLKPTLV
jgi:hypothetical protein